MSIILFSVIHHLYRGNKFLQSNYESLARWKSANIGRWGQVKGVLNSLFLAGPMNDLLTKDIALDAQHADAYYVLGELYRELPGWPLSFGNIDFAVSLGRLAVDMRADQVASGKEKAYTYAFYTELAKSLYKRNWDAAHRAADQKANRARYDAAKGVIERGSYYESTVTIKDMSDREEAKAMVQWVVAQLGAKATRMSDDDKDYSDAQDVLNGWK